MIVGKPSGTNPFSLGSKKIHVMGIKNQAPEGKGSSSLAAQLALWGLGDPLVCETAKRKTFPGLGGGRLSLWSAHYSLLHRTLASHCLSSEQPGDFPWL